MGLIDLLIPPRCLACRTAGVEPFCADCADELVPDGQPHLLDDGVLTISAMVYGGPLATAIKAVKTGGMRAGADALARLMDLPPDLVTTWVPAPATRRRRRGLDLPQHLAGEDATRLLRRIGRPTEQPDVDRAGRLAAQVGTFEACQPVGGRVVLVDDVRATGATLLEAAQVLRRAGASTVVGVTLAGAGGAPSAARRHPPRRPNTETVQPTTESGTCLAQPPGRLL